jgi:hypothetical protein
MSESAAESVVPFPPYVENWEMPEGSLPGCARCLKRKALRRGLERGFASRLVHKQPVAPHPTDLAA